MAGDDLRIKVADNRNPAQGICEGPDNAEEASLIAELRRLSAGPEPSSAQLRSQSEGDEVDGDAGHDLVAAVSD
jgi:hypothetical protein